MQIVIDIDEKDFKAMKHNVAVDFPICSLSEPEMVTIVANGTPLPKGHGKLIDADKLLSQFPIWVDNVNSATINATILKAQTIIEADKELGK